MNFFLFFDEELYPREATEEKSGEGLMRHARPQPPLKETEFSDHVECQLSRKQKNFCPGMHGKIARFQLGWPTFH